MYFREQYSKPTSRNKGYSKTPPDSAIDDGRQLHSPSGPSPQMDEYSDTLRQIQRAASHRSGKVWKLYFLRVHLFEMAVLAIGLHIIDNLYESLAEVTGLSAFCEIFFIVIYIHQDFKLKVHTGGIFIASV